MCEITEATEYKNIYFDNTLLTCPRCQGLFFYNPDTAQILKMKCKTYSCPFCGGKKAKSLEIGITKWIEKWELRRLWTFTYRTTMFQDYTDIECIKFSSQIWHYFITYVRRHPALNKTLRNFQYIRVLEFTKKGFPHYHCFFDRYLPIQIMHSCWCSAINTVMKTSGTMGNVDIAKHCHDAVKAAAYVVKYVLKSVDEFPSNRGFRLYTKSSRVSLFEKFAKNGKWYMINCFHSLLDLEIVRVTAHHEFQILLENIEKELTQIDNIATNSDSS